MRVFGLALFALWLVAGCIFGERLGGPTLSVRNDSRQAVVVRLDRTKWQIPPGQAGLLGQLPTSALAATADVDVLDADGCAKRGSVSVGFKDAPDQVLLIADGASPTARPIQSSDPRGAQIAPSVDPNLCQGPADGWSLFVVNRTDRNYELHALAPDAGGVAAPSTAVFQIAPGASGVVIWPTVPNVQAGSVDIVDPVTCQTIARLDHPAFGTFVVSIDGGDATIAAGPLPSGEQPLPGGIPRSQQSCAPAPS